MTINVFENAMIDEQAYGPGDWPDEDDAMKYDGDPAAERMADYLDDQDAAADWTPGGIWNDGFAASYDEWNAIRAQTGQQPGTYTEYLEAIGAHLAELRRGHEAVARKLGWIE